VFAVFAGRCCCNECKNSGADHEFATLNGVKEDMTEIILNVKRLVIRKTSSDAKIIKLSADKTGVVNAGQIRATRLSRLSTKTI
jgi:DNA-directed RNA polymerase alpha subunit